MSNPVSACPKCGHVRGLHEPAPAWQCPACGIAYHKYPAYLEAVRGRARRVVTPPTGEEPAPRLLLDGSVWALIATNAVAIGIAMWNDWSARPLVLLYWAQSAIIGIASVFRILAPERFTTGRFEAGGHVYFESEVATYAPTPDVKRGVALRFSVVFGLLLLLYYFVISLGPRGAPLDWGWILTGTAAFALNHVWSYRYNRDLDRRGTPNITMFAFIPYLRIVPMHLVVVTGAVYYVDGGAPVLFFGVVKTVFDVVMHVHEHSHLQVVGSATQAPP